MSNQLKSNKQAHFKQKRKNLTEPRRTNPQRSSRLK